MRAALLLVGLAAAAWLAWPEDAPPERDTRDPGNERHAPDGDTPTPAGDSAATRAALNGQDAPGLDPRDLHNRLLSESAHERSAAYAEAGKAARIPFDEELVRLMVAWLQSGTLELVQRAHGILARIGPAAIPYVKPLLRSEVSAVRAHALTVYSWWRQGGFKGVTYPSLRPHFEDKHMSVRKAAFELILHGLPYDGDTAAWLKAHIIPGLSPIGADGTERALARMGAQGFADVLAMLDDPTLLYNGLAGLSGARAKNLKSAFPRLQTLLRSDTEARAKSMAIRLLSKLRGDCEEMLPVLIELLPKEPYPVRVSILLALKSMGRRAAPAVDAVLVALSDADERIVRWAAEALASSKHAPERVIPALRAAMKGDVGLNVGAALGAFGSAAMPYIEEALDQDDERTAYHALFAAAVLGPKAAPLSGRIVALLDAVDANVRVQAARTLAKIGPAGAAGVPGILGLLHDGTLTAVQAAPILMALGKPAQTAIHAELTGSGSTVDRERVLGVLAAFTGRTAFAFDALRPYLKDRAASTRRLAVQAVLAALEPPRDSLASRPWENTVLVANVRKLLEAMRDDANRAIRKTVATALEQLDQRAR